LELLIKLNINNKLIDTSLWPIFKNEKISEIKEKIFVYYKDPDSTQLWIPEFISLSYNNPDNLIQKQNFIKQQDKNLYKQNTLYVTNLLQENLQQHTYENLLIKYPSLTPKLLEFAMEIIKMKNTNHFDTELIKLNIQNIVLKQESLQIKWDKINKLFVQFLQYDHLQEFNTYFNNLSVLSLELSFLNKQQIGITDNQKNFINLFNLFNNTILNENVVCCILNSSYATKSTTQFFKKEPIIKVYKNIPTNIDVKSWIVNEKKKNNVVSFKKIKGIVFKIIYKKLLFSINLLQNGTMTVSIDFLSTKYNQTLDSKNYSELIELSKDCYSYFLNYISKIPNIYYFSKKLLNNFTYTVTSFSSEYPSLRINKNAFSDFVMQKTITENLFKLKDTLSKDPISLFYNVNTSEDSKGITVNIKDSPYTIDSSIITVFDSKNLIQSNVIFKFVLLIDHYNKIHNLDIEEEVQKIKTKSTIKDLKKQGVDIESTNCQKPRQPKVGEYLKPQKDSYLLEWNKQKYICPQTKYPYPGFTNKNIVCCFTKDQRRTAKYIKNFKSQELEILVQPSNFKVKIKDSKTSKTFDTFVIKVISSNKQEHIDRLNDSPYFYLDFYNDNLNLVPISNAQLIDELKQIDEDLNRTIWLDPVPLTTLTTTAPKNKCNNPPNLQGPVEDFCKKYKEHSKFGYNLNSYPCCFEKDKDPFVIKKKKQTDFIKQHILKTDKLLDIDRLGELPLFLNKIFIPLIQNNNQVEEQALRMGVLQNNNSFINCIFSVIDKKFNDSIFNNVFEFKMFIKKQFIQQQLFHKIFDGNLIMFWKNQDDFFKDFLSQNKYIDFSIFIDMFFQILKLNIFIINIDSESKDANLMCFNKYDPDYKSCILIKRNSNQDERSDFPNFEILVIYSPLENTKITKIFSTQSKIVDLLVKYIKVSCKKDQNYPDKYKFTKPFDYEYVQQNYTIVAQIVSFNKVNWLQTQNGILLPIQEHSIQGNIPIVSIENAPLHSAEYVLSKINSYHLKSIGIIKTNDIFDCLLLENGLFIPISKNNNTDSPILQQNIYPVLYYKKLEKATLPFFDKLNKNIYDTKKLIANKINIPDNLNYKTKILDIVLSNKLDYSDKFNQIYKIIKSIEATMSKSKDFYIKIVVNDIINDPITKNILNNTVSKYKININKLTKNNNEIIITNLKDLFNNF
jgi:hypothetical protein